MDPSRWPCDYPREVKERDIREERWESLAYYATWTREKRFKGEDVAWYSGGHGKMVVGKVAKIKCGVCTVYRTPETEEEKKLGNYYTKELEEWKLFPPISQKQALILMRNTPGGCRPEEVSPFECSGCNRVRISMRSERDKWNVGWSGPNKSPYGGVFCKECYDSNKINERDLTIQELREMKSKLSTKMVGETLEIHCETQFNLNRATAFKNSYFEKDNDVTSGSKGDYIFKEFDNNGI